MQQFFNEYKPQSTFCRKVNKKYYKKRFVLLLWVLAFFVLSPFVAAAQTTPPAPNIILFVGDDWSYHTSIAGDSLAQTPTYDFLAKSGAVRFSNAFMNTPSCTAARSILLTGQYAHQLGAGGVLWGSLDIKIPVFTQILEKNGYFVRSIGKGWSPGSWQQGGYTEDPVGEKIKSVEEFFQQIPASQSFFLWYGSTKTHRPFLFGEGKNKGIDPQQIKVPPFLPDTDSVRLDLCDYYQNVREMDDELKKLVEQLKAKKLLHHTIIIVVSDNGMAFPHGKTQLYDTGTRMPLLIYAPMFLNAEHSCENTNFVSLLNIAPTILDLAGVPVASTMLGSSLKPYLLPQRVPLPACDSVFLEFNRHGFNTTNKIAISPPTRAYRNTQFLYIKNYQKKATSFLADCDNSPTKKFLIQHRKDKIFNDWIHLLYPVTKPAEELYEVQKDPFQLNNIADDSLYQDVLSDLRQRLHQWQKNTQDPLLQNEEYYNTLPHYRPVSEAATKEEEDIPCH